MSSLLRDIRACHLCADLPLGPKPLIQLAPGARILIAGQAPGQRTHAKGIPFDDASGNRLRDWLGMSRDQFYDPARVAIVPMGFCFPGSGAGGDLPPRPICARTWRQQIIDHLPDLELTLVIGRFALGWHLPELAKEPLTKTAGNWRAQLPHRMVLPHPSPRNNRWLKQNPWFERDAIPALQHRVGQILSGGTDAG